MTSHRGDDYDDCHQYVTDYRTTSSLNTHALNLITVLYVCSSNKCPGHTSAHSIPVVTILPGNIHSTPWPSLCGTSYPSLLDPPRRQELRHWLALCLLTGLNYRLFPFLFLLPGVVCNTGDRQGRSGCKLLSKASGALLRWTATWQSSLVHRQATWTEVAPNHID